MNQHDDPEERIRQLEQSAAGYGAVELGGQQYRDGTGPTPTEQLPPPVYGAPPPSYGPPPPVGNPYGTPPFGVSFPQGPRKGAPVGMIFGIIAVFVIVMFGVIGAVVWNVTSNVGSITETFGGGTVNTPGGSVDKPGGTLTESAPSAAPAIPAEPPAETAPSGGQFSVAGIDENEDRRLQ